MYNVIFYEDKNGYSQLYDDLIKLANNSVNNKDYRIQLNQINYCIELLKNNGTKLPNNITKHIKDNIWELRPGNNRVMYFYFNNNTFILLHMFRKKTQKTPKSEIIKAEKEIKDYLIRNGGI
ncbi:MAG: type II toxin-antitoxin system RelE/ParE family toxin [bacterium]|nr:type II toxin-antitoxin system RelE/ParE family toxin [bacterium]